jgi:hypothetical protein
VGSIERDGFLIQGILEIYNQFFLFVVSKDKIDSGALRKLDLIVRCHNLEICVIEMTARMDIIVFIECYQDQAIWPALLLKHLFINSYMIDCSNGLILAIFWLWKRPL